MAIRTRKFVGTIALLVLLVAWALLAMGIAPLVLPSANGIVAFAYYLVVGIAWVLPAMPLVRWMVKPHDRR
jgi:Protein of unknown function (DUF2842)